MTSSDRPPVSQSQPEEERKLLRRGLSVVTVLGSAYLLGVSGFRYVEAAICSTGGCSMTDCTGEAGKIERSLFW